LIDMMIVILTGGDPPASSFDWRGIVR